MDSARTRLMNTTLALAAGVLLLGLEACSTGDFDGVRPSQGARHASRSGAREAESSDKDRYFKLEGKKHEPAGGRVGFIQMPRELWAPFRFETSGGLYDLNHPATQGRFCTEIGRTGSPPSQYYGMCANILPGGLQVYAYAHTSGSALGSVVFAGATEVDFAIETSGSGMTFYSRPTGNPVWVEIATHPFSGQTVPLFPAVGAVGIGKKEVVGFDNFRLVSNSPSPDAQSSEQIVATALWSAADGMLESMHGLDGTAPDYDAAATDLAQSQSDLAAAKSLVASVTDSRLRSKVKTLIRKAQRKLADATSQVGKRKKAGRAIDHLRSSMKSLLKAVFKLTPPPPPDP